MRRVVEGVRHSSTIPFEHVEPTFALLGAHSRTQKQVEPFKQRDWEAKRQANDLKEVQQAAGRLGVKADVIEVGAARRVDCVRQCVWNRGRRRHCTHTLTHPCTHTSAYKRWSLKLPLYNCTHTQLYIGSLSDHLVYAEVCVWVGGWV